jgi:pseudo-rSAM protein
MQTLKSYWLYLESYANLTIKDNNFIIYNTLSGEYVERFNSPKLSEIIRDLDKKDNLWCIEITENQLLDNEIRDLITDLRKIFVADIMDKSLSKGKPFQFKPILNIHRDVHKSFSFSNITGGEVLGYLNELVFYVNEYCDHQCEMCNLGYKQFNYCHKNNSNNQEFSFDLLHKNILTAVNSGVRKISLIGGNIFKYSKLNELIELLKRTTVKTEIFINYLNIDKNVIEQFNEKSTINILIDYSSLDNDKVSDLLDLKSHASIKCTFVLNCESDWEKAELFAEDFPELKCNFLPYFNGNNEVFFESNVFLNKEDLFLNALSTKEIFRNQVLNSSNFGKLTIKPDGSVFANINNDALGNLYDDSLHELVYKELKSGASWFSIRNSKPCIDCLYQWLCPSPSNYEIALNRHNLCNINKCLYGEHKEEVDIIGKH